MYTLLCVTLTVQLLLHVASAWEAPQRNARMQPSDMPTMGQRAPPSEPPAGAQHGPPPPPPPQQQHGPPPHRRPPVQPVSALDEPLDGIDDSRPAPRISLLLSRPPARPSG